MGQIIASEVATGALPTAAPAAATTTTTTTATTTIAATWATRIAPLLGFVDTNGPTIDFKPIRGIDDFSNVFNFYLNKPETA